MNRRLLPKLSPRHLVLGLACLVPGACLAGEPVIFSRPAVALAVPAQAAGKIPEPRAKVMDFSPGELEAPVMPPPASPQPMVRPDRDEPRDDRHWLLRTPRMFAEPDDGKKPQDGFTGGREFRPPSSLSDDLERQARPGQPRALSPVTDFNWSPMDGLGATGRKAGDRGSEARTAESLGRSLPPLGEAGQSGGFRPESMWEQAPARPREKEKYAAAQKERRAAFEQLLNPNAGTAARLPSALQPVVSATDARPGNLAMPSLAAPRLNPRSEDPTTAFNKQHQDRLRGPVLEDPNQRYNNPLPPAVTSPYDRYGSPSAAPPVMQPSRRDYRVRKGL